jgi:hypothetical protein
MTADYSFRVTGRLTPSLLKALDPLASTESATGTVLTARVPDQAALHGFIARIAGLGLELVELQRLPPSGSTNGSRPRFDPERGSGRGQAC